MLGVDLSRAFNRIDLRIDMDERKYLFNILVAVLIQYTAHGPHVTYLQLSVYTIIVCMNIFSSVKSVRPT